MTAPDEPIWLTRRIIDVIHYQQIQEHGGGHGVRDDDAIESALARPRQGWAYAPGCDRAELAAAYAFGLSKNHGYVDGNKRVAFMALYTFLGLNGEDLDAPETEVVAIMLAVADGSLSEEELARWVRGRTTPRP